MRFFEDVIVADPAARISFEGYDTDTYIQETADDVLDTYVGATHIMRVNTSGMNIDDINELTADHGVHIEGVIIKDGDVELPANGDRLYLGPNTNNTYIYTSGLGEITFVQGNSIFMQMQSNVVLGSGIHLNGWSAKTNDLGASALFLRNAYLDRYYIDNTEVYLDVSGTASNYNMTFTDSFNAAVTLSSLTTNFDSTTDGNVPASGGGTTNFLRADGTWADPPGDTSPWIEDTNGITYSAGNVGIGGASDATYNLRVYGTTLFNGNTFQGDSVSSYYGSGNDGRIWHDGSTWNFRSYLHGAGVYFQGEDAGGTVRTMISFDPDNSVYLHYNGTITFNTIDSGAEVTDTTDAVFRITSTKNGTWSAGEVLGGLEWYGSDGSGIGAGVKAYIRAEAFDTDGADFDLKFGTCDGSSAVAERMVITRLGNVGIGLASGYPTYQLEVEHAAGGSDGVKIKASSSSGQAGTLQFRNTNAGQSAGAHVGTIEFFKSDPSGQGAGVVGRIYSRAYDVGSVYDLYFETGQDVVTPGGTNSTMYLTYTGGLYINAAQNAILSLDAGTTSYDAYVRFRENGTTTTILGYDTGIDSFQIHTGTAFTTLAAADFSISAAGEIYMGNIDGTGTGTSMLYYNRTTGEVTYANAPGTAGGYSFNNGLTESGGVVELGGEINDDITFDFDTSSTHNFSIGTASSVLNNFYVYADNDILIQSKLGTSGTALLKLDGYAPTYSVDGPNIELTHEDSSNDKKGFEIYSSNFLVHDAQDSKGMYYSGDYSSGAGNRWITDKEYVDGVSDRRLKDDIILINEPVMPKVIQLNSYTFHLKKDVEKKRRFGLMAQEVIELFPEAVHEVDDGYLNVHYKDFVAVVVAGMREHYLTTLRSLDTLTDHEKRIQDLESEVDKLKDQLGKVA